MQRASDPSADAPRSTAKGYAVVSVSILHVGGRDLVLLRLGAVLPRAHGYPHAYICRPSVLTAHRG